ncbi:MAG: ATP-binding protein [Oscillospiraceae bacterium]|nr:ATP-binding protein [Oscillospiraceae bacterium]
MKFFRFLYRSFLKVYQGCFKLAKDKRKLLFLLIPATIILISWIFRDVNIILSLLADDLMALPLIITLYIIGTPKGTYRWERAMKKWGIFGEKNEIPRLIHSVKDVENPNIIHNTFVKPNGLTKDRFIKYEMALEEELNITIKNIEYAKFGYGKNKQKIVVTSIPAELDMPMIISLNNDKLSDMLCKHWCVVGHTGSGKSYAISVLLGKIIKSTNENIEITIADFKNSFKQFENTGNYFSFDKSELGIKKFYNEFMELVSGEKPLDNKIRVLFVDELNTTLDTLSAQGKEGIARAAELKKSIASILAMGRSFGCFLWIGMQAAYSDFFNHGARDNFGCILGLGELSKEQKSMLFKGYEDKLNEINGVGEGFCLIKGKGVERVKIEPIEDKDALNDIIRQAMCH